MVLNVPMMISNVVGGSPAAGSSAAPRNVSCAETTLAGASASATGVESGTTAVAALSRSTSGCVGTEDVVDTGSEGWNSLGLINQNPPNIAARTNSPITNIQPLLAGFSTSASGCPATTGLDSFAVHSCTAP